MAAISLLTAGRVEVIKSNDQTTLTCGVDITAGWPIYADSSGNWANATGADAAHSTGIHIATKAAKKGEALTGIRAGEMDGFNVSGMAYNDPVFVADAGTLSTTAGTVSVIVGRVMPALANSFFAGAARDKVVRIACPI